jgi:hypothetical protein
LEIYVPIIIKGAKATDLDLRESAYIPPKIQVIESAFNKSKYDPKGIAQMKENLTSPAPIFPPLIAFKIK